jgi:hypothetical protein
MLANAQNLEQAVSQSSPIALLILWIVVLLGLVIWLGGLGLRKILFPVIGILTGGIAGFLLTNNFKWALLPAVLGLIIASVIEWKLVSGSVKGQLFWAFIFSLCGAIMVCAGMVILLTYKGAEPVKAVNENKALYFGIFAAMTLFGTIIQTLFCRGPKKQLQTEENADNS